MPQIATCKVLEEHPTGLLREVTMMGKPDAVQERVEFFPLGNVRTLPSLTPPRAAPLTLRAPQVVFNMVDPKINMVIPKINIGRETAKINMGNLGTSFSEVR